MADVGDVDVFDLLAGSATAADEGAESDREEAVGIPSALEPLPPCPAPATPELLVQTLLESDVQASKERFNSTNHHEWAPFLGEEDGSVRADRVWWRSLPEALRRDIAAVVAVREAEGEVERPHEAQIASHEGCGRAYHAYLDGFSFSRWRNLLKSSVLVPLSKRDRRRLEEISRRRALGGSGLQSGEAAELSVELRRDLDRAIRSVGGRAFAKTAEKSAKNDVKLKPHLAAESIFAELTSSLDVLKQSLGTGGTAHRKTCGYLVVQPWDDTISKASEFRVFIRDRRVVGITQQIWSVAVGHTATSARDVAERLLRFWREELLPLCPYRDCCLDVSVDLPSSKVRLIEINPCGLWGSSGSGLFHWLEDRALLDGSGPLPVRVVVAERDGATLRVESPAAVDAEEV